MQKAKQDHQRGVSASQKKNIEISKVWGKIHPSAALNSKTTRQHEKKRSKWWQIDVHIK
jgi:hypothetical protein